LLPVRWVDGWPVFLDPGQPVPFVSAKPNLPAFAGTDWSAWTDSFDSAELSPEWLRMRSPRSEPWFVLGSGALELTARTDTAGGSGQPSFLGRRLRHPAAIYSTRLNFSPERDGDFAGLLALIDQAHFLAFGVEQVDGARMLTVRKRAAADQPERGELTGAIPLPERGEIELKLAIDRGQADRACRTVGAEAWNSVAQDLDIEFLSSVHAGLFTGVLVGPYVVSGG
jgi:alpha-N-arabinofuranosidase